MGRRLQERWAFTGAHAAVLQHSPEADVEVGVVLCAHLVLGADGAAREEFMGPGACGRRLLACFLQMAAWEAPASSEKVDVRFWRSAAKAFALVTLQVLIR